MIPSNYRNNYLNYIENAVRLIPLIATAATASDLKTDEIEVNFFKDIFSEYEVENEKLGYLIILGFFQLDGFIRYWIVGCHI